MAWLPQRGSVGRGRLRRSVAFGSVAAARLSGSVAALPLGGLVSRLRCADSSDERAARPYHRFTDAAKRQLKAA